MSLAVPALADTGAGMTSPPVVQAVQLWNGQLLQPEGQAVALPGHPCDLKPVVDGRFILVKTPGQLITVDAGSLQIVQHSAYPDRQGGSAHGLAVTRDGLTAYVSGARDALFTVNLATNGTFNFGDTMSLADTNGQPVNPLGLAMNPDGKRLLVTRSRLNDIVVVNPATRQILARAATGVCPYDVVVLPNGRWAFVSNFGGQKAVDGVPTEKSAGTDVIVDDRSLPLLGSLSILFLSGQPVPLRQIQVGLHPTVLALNSSGQRLFVSNEGNDAVSVVDTVFQSEIGELPLLGDMAIPWGSQPDGVTLSTNNHTVYATAAGLNAVACFNLLQPQSPPELIPTGHYPGAICLTGGNLFVADVQGGRLEKISPSRRPAEAAAQDTRVRINAHLAEARREVTRPAVPAAPVPVPAHLGDVSVIKHIVYIIKANQPYDALLGDVGQGDSNPDDVMFDRAVVPNHKAIARRFVLLDHYHSNGETPATGPAWCLQGITTPYLEKNLLGQRGGTGLGDDALAPASSGFLWDEVFHVGLPFRNYGVLGRPVRDANPLGFHNVYQFDGLGQNSCPEYPGADLSFSDQSRADAFLKELAQYERHGDFPSLLTLCLPNDHAAGEYKASSYLADNDLALGRCLDGLSHSRFWMNTAVFVVEAGPLQGRDHVDSHRSICLIASPWAKPGQVVSRFYNEDSVLHTIDQILGLPPLNLLVAAAPLMDDCFQTTPTPAPYACLTPSYPLNLPRDEPDPKSHLKRKLAVRTASTGGSGY